jgi:hypothetical protein
MLKVNSAAAAYSLIGVICEICGYPTIEKDKWRI